MTHPAHIRAEAVAAVLAGEPLSDVARRYGLPKGTLGNWMADVDPQGLERLRTLQKRPSLDQLIGDYLVIGFRAMISQAEVFSDPAYCRSQDADKLAIAHGVLGDKLAGVAAAAQALGFLGLPLETRPEQAQLGAPGAPENA